MSRGLGRYSRFLYNIWHSSVPLPNPVKKRLISTAVSAKELQFGQPLHETHPHLLKAGELTLGVTALEYAQRRSKLAAKLPANAMAIVAASDIVYRTGHVFYDFHQDPDFFYLTGFNEPQALAVIGKTSHDEDHTFHLFVRGKDSKAELWDGARSGTQAAADVFNADETGDINYVHKLLAPLVNDAAQIYTDLPSSPARSSKFLDFFQGSAKPPRYSDIVQGKKVKPLRSLMNELRITKSHAEIDNMRMAGRVSGRAFTETARRRFSSEKQLEVFLQYQFEKGGCDRTAFEPVVAGGRNALSIHYVRNDDVLNDGQLVLTDAGGEYGGYLADITRTWPVSGKFSPQQRDLYEAVLTVQRSCIAQCRQDANTSLELLHQKAERELTEELNQIGFDMSWSAINILFPHHLSHHVGLDLHDCVGYPKNAPLTAGQCITVEPGVYVPFDDRFPTHFQGIGIRVEDSVCVGETSPLVLTTEAVKEVDDIEALRR